MKHSILFLSVFFLLMPSIAIASTWPTSNVCEIKAEVLSMNKHWVANADTDLGMFIQLTLKVMESGNMVRRYSDTRSCAQVLPVGKKLEAGDYERNLLGNLQTLKEGQMIQGAIVSYVKGFGIRSFYVFQATEKNTPLIKVLSP